MIKKPNVKIPESHSESIVCPDCGEEFGIEDKVEYERVTQRDADVEYYEPLIKEMYEALESWEELWDMRPLDSGDDMQQILERCWDKTELALAKAEGDESPALKFNHEIHDKYGW